MANLSKTELGKLAEIRKELKARKPYFVRQCLYKKSRITNDEKWKKPKGMHSKLRNAFKGHAKRVKVGYRGPEEVRGITSSGLFPVLVENVSQLSIVGENQGALISSGVGMKNKLLILEEAKKKNITILNVKDTGKFAEEAKSAMEKRKQERKEKLERKKRKAEKKKEPKKEEKPAEQKTAEEQKIEQKKEIDKVLTTKG